MRPARCCCATCSAAPHHTFHVVGFVDDDRAKRKKIVGGKTVLGAVEDLPTLARRHDVEHVLIAIPQLRGERVREILELCADLKLSFKILPVSFSFFSRRNASNLMQDLSPDDLLPREAIELGATGESPCTGATALVTGAAGSIGSEICRQLARGGARRLVMVDQNESGLYLLARDLGTEHPALDVIAEVGDICDANRVGSIFERYRPRDVFHAAANKHVPLMEAAPCEAVKTNVEGTRIVARLAAEHRAERFVLISTDKAVRPTSVMGATKRICESVIRELAATTETSFCAVRFGNVLGSAGSVVPLFQRQISAGGPLTVTHPDVRRYFMTIREAVSLVLHAGYSDAGTLYVLDMGEQIKIVDLARHMITMSGLTPDRDIAIEFVGLRPGEKLYEELLTDEEEQTRQVDSKIFVATSPSPATDFRSNVDALVASARREDADAVLDILGYLAPGYARPEDDAAIAKSAS